MTDKKQLNIIINFQDTYELMKSYLSKKRFNYVYEEVIKFYNKNVGQIANHEVIKLIQLIFYILKKKFILKTNPLLKKFSLLPLEQIYLFMRNLYLGWENALILQLNAEDPNFFNMFFRHHTDRNIKKIVGSQNFIFMSKRDFIITGKINVEYKLYLFLKQTLEMATNSLFIMFFSSKKFSKKDIISKIEKTNNIFEKVSENIFPIEKSKFYILKCQILEIIQKNEPLNKSEFPIKYYLPIGLLRLLYNNISKWNQKKLNHTVKILVKMICISLKNELLDIQDAYILANQIKIIILLINKKQVENEKTIFSQLRKGVLQTKINILAEDTSQDEQNQKNHKKRQKYESKSKNRHLAALSLIINQIQDYIQSKRQVQIIINTYIRDIYLRYKINPSQLNDEIIDQIPILNQKQNKKNKIALLFLSNEANTSTYRPTGAKGKSNILHLLKKDTQYEDQYSKINQNLIRKKDNKMIIKNIMNIKNCRNKLLLENRKVLIQKHDIIENNKKPEQNQNIEKICRNLRSTSVKQISTFSTNQFQSINFFDQSESDEEGEMKYSFEKKRRQLILQVNNKFYKKNNPNPFQCEETQDLEENQCESINQTENQNSLLEKKSKISEDFVFEEIKLLDEVIKQKIFTFLNLDKKKFKSSKINQIHKNSEMQIESYQKIIEKTNKLKQEVQELNKQKNLLLDKLNYRKISNKMQQKYQGDRQQLQSKFTFSSNLKDLQNIYNTKNNLALLAQKHIEQSTKLFRLDKNRNSSINGILQKYGKIYKKYDEQQNSIGLQEQQDIDNEVLPEEIEIIEYIVQNRPISLLQKTLKQKEQLLKGNHYFDQIKQIALRQEFDGLRGNICKTHFNQQNNLSKNFIYPNHTKNY